MKATCPACSHYRRKKTDRCLEYKRDYAKCYHCGFYSYDKDSIEIWLLSGQITTQMETQIINYNY